LIRREPSTKRLFQSKGFAYLRASLKTSPLITSTRHPSPKEKDKRSF
jgi:hypothetical protein